MSGTDGEVDPRQEIASEVQASISGTLQKSALTADTGKLEACVLAHITFEPELPVDRGVERILIEKSQSWIPASGRSLKPGNLRFNLGGLFEAIVSGVGAAAAFSATPIIAVLSGLVALRLLKRSAEIDLSELDALVVWALWTAEQSGGKTGEADIQAISLREAARVDSTLHPSLAEIRETLAHLEKIGAIRKDGDAWETYETIVVRT